MPIAPFNVTTGNATTIPYDNTAGNITITSTNSTTNGTSTGSITIDPPRDKAPIQLVVANDCGESVWPGIVTQAGTGPGTGGFELSPDTSRLMWIGPDWAGRIWGRTNCSFNADGSGPSNNSGVDGYVPATLAEFTLQGGSSNDQTFYDISLVDGYNLPLTIIYHPSKNTSWIPPNLTNPSCIASSGYLSSHLPLILPQDTNATTNPYPIPYEPTQTNSSLLNWCPFDLQKLPRRPGFRRRRIPYPDDGVPGRPSSRASRRAPRRATRRTAAREVQLAGRVQAKPVQQQCKEGVS
ncbi:hypothetical protein N0V88_003808 [Collariella sp. IMI 366227]|nr:hypothetical protein N0V88_003808 [Collariella sp. IMI 366227]